MSGRARGTSAPAPAASKLALAAARAAAIVVALGGCTTTGDGSGAGSGAATDADGADGARGATEIVFTGGDSFSEAELRRVIEEDLKDFEARGRRKSMVDDAAFSLEVHYGSRGFPFVRVTPQHEPLPDGGARVGFLIEEGQRTVIEAIRLQGNQRFSDAELRGMFHGPTVGLLGTGSLYYVHSNLRAAAAAIASLYWGAGYLKAEIGDPEVTFSADRTRAIVTLTIREGLPYRLVKVEITGPLGMPESELREEVAGFIGQPYFPQVAYAARARLLEFYGNRGHPDAAVTLEEVRDDATGDVGLLFVVAPGPAVSVSEVRVTGIARTQEDFILARLKLQPGEGWSKERERQSFADLYRSGLFSKVDITLEPAPAGADAVREQERVVEVEVVERSSKEAYVEPGYGSYEGPRLTLGYRDRNVLGGGRIFHTEGSVSSKAQRGLIGMTDPWFLGGAVSADVSVFINHRKEPSFTRDEIGTAATLTRQHGNRWQTEWGYSFRRSEISDVDVVDSEAQEALEDVDISAFSFAPAYESRDDLFAPKRGSSMRASLEWGDAAIGSELNFVRGRFGQSWFRPLGRAGAIGNLGVLGVSFRTGVIVPTGSTDVIPLQERFYNGGENTVRSFQEDELGPKDSDGNPVGGETFSVFSIEWRRPLKGKLEGAVFLDAGNVVEQYEDYFDFPGSAFAIGAGLRYMLPIGPVRFDVGFNPSPDEFNPSPSEEGDGWEEDVWVAHLSVGMPF